MQSLVSLCQLLIHSVHLNLNGEVKVLFFFFCREEVKSFFFFEREFQTKTPINFWCRQRLNPRSLIQPSETLPVELTGTHQRSEELGEGKK